MSPQIHYQPYACHARTRSGKLTNEKIGQAAQTILKAGTKMDSHILALILLATAVGLGFVTMARHGLRTEESEPE
ncbi:hypothetical protein ACFO8Q_23365 [Effusibacillus consociatus]|uniref:Uncharacterized protein n=1 Tax=Effusibacillus consociatus TaxID=1117041 RepID=A0ABV9Q843_9BACL